MADTIGELIMAGKFDEAEKMLASVPARRDLSTSALEADIRAGETQARQGQKPSFDLTRSGQFNPEESALSLQERLRARTGAENAQTRTLDREDKRLSILTKQFGINAKFKREELNNKVDGMVRAIKREKSPEARIGILQSVLDSYTKILQIPEVSGDRRESLQQVSDAISAKLAEKVGQLER